MRRRYFGPYLYRPTAATVVSIIVGAVTSAALVLDPTDVQHNLRRWHQNILRPPVDRWARKRIISNFSYFSYGPPELDGHEPGRWEIVRTTTRMPKIDPARNINVECLHPGSCAVADPGWDGPSTGHRHMLGSTDVQLLRGRHHATCTKNGPVVQKIGE